MKNHTLSVVACLASLLATDARARGQSLDQWTRQLGTPYPDESTCVSADGLGNVYISGSTGGSLGGPNAGAGGAFVSKYDAAGNLQWTRQLGTGSYTPSYGVSADGLGNVYISGVTWGDLDGPNAGDTDAFVSKYDAAGALQWTRQLGTSGYDHTYGVSADGLGNVYISGSTHGSLGGPNAGDADAFVSKYDAAGALQWTRQLGTSNGDSASGVSADGLGNVYISGLTGGSLGEPNAGGVDAFISKYDAAGALQWTRQLGTSDNDQSYGVSADGLGDVYISGSTNGSLGGPHAGDLDAFVSKYDAAGALQWTRQLGTRTEDSSSGVSADGLGNVYISGWTIGSLGGTRGGTYDAFVSKYDAAGVLKWTRQLDAGIYDYSYGVSADGLGNVYISGSTSGSMGGPYAGSADAFLAKIVPEPGSLLVGIIAGAGLVVRRRGRNAAA